jgi:hypothetical protein
MVGVLGQHPPQLPTADDQHPVQQLPSDGADPPFGVGVGPRRPHRRAQHPDPLGREHRVERGGELGIPIPDEKPELADAVSNQGGDPVTEQQLARMAKRRLAILRHAEEITGNVALTCR